MHRDEHRDGKKEGRGEKATAAREPKTKPADPKDPPEEQAGPAEPAGPAAAPGAPAPAGAEAYAEEAAAPELSREELEDLVRKAGERDLFRNELQRERADFSNYQKRVLRDRPQIEEQAVRRFVLDILPLLDNFDRALGQEAATVEALREGIRIVAETLWEALRKHGFEEIEALGKAFDPFLHEAVAYEETSSFPPDTVCEVVQKGFTHRGTVIRAARVKVARAPADVAAPQGEG